MTQDSKIIKIFFVEDDLSFGAVLKSYLEINNYHVKWIDDGKYAVEKFRSEEYDLCILDVMLPNVDGFSIGKEIKFLSPEMPMIYLTAKALKEDILSGYKIGADDYITKPFDTEVLLCKIEAILKRASQISGDNLPESYSIGKFQFDTILRTITIAGSVVHLSPKESELLRMLCEHKNSLLPRELALKTIWGEDGYFTARSMDVYVTKLRKYLKDDPSIEINNIHGSGFIMSVN
jgi:DNA-binding response OmpR family regulator